MDEQKKKIYDFIRGLKIGVISTVTPTGAPQGAVVEFAETEGLEIIFNTFATYRKYENILRDPRVSFTIGWDHDVTVQYEGVARELSGDELTACKAIFAHKIRDAAKWDKFPETRYFIVKPTWIRFNSLGGDHKEVFTVTF